MDQQERIAAWKAEEEIAHIQGWDFSHIDGKCQEVDALPWDYREVVQRYLKPEMQLLDIDTGGGEVLLSLEHPFANTAASEGYPPNAALCEQRLLPLGIDFRTGHGYQPLPFEDARFDIIINRHGSFVPSDICRMLKPGGLFVTQQVGARNERELVELLCGQTQLPFPEHYYSAVEKEFRNAGFDILEGGESFPRVRFLDVGALVWFARIIQWEFPNFSVDNNLPYLMNAQRLLEETGYIEGTYHRFLLVARKKGEADGDA